MTRDPSADDDVNDNDPDRPRGDEIEWTDDDEAAAAIAWARIAARREAERRAAQQQGTAQAQAQAQTTHTFAGRLHRAVPHTLLRKGGRL